MSAADRVALERRLAQLRVERQENQANQVHECDFLDTSGVTIRVGDKIAVRNNPAILEEQERLVPRRDKSKAIYLGEKGKVTRLWANLHGHPAVELRFADDAMKWFYLPCLELGPSTEGDVDPSPQSVAQHPPPRHIDPHVSSPAPSWQSLRRPQEARSIPVAAASPLVEVDGLGEPALSTTFPAASDNLIPATPVGVDARVSPSKEPDAKPKADKPLVVTQPEDDLKFEEELLMRVQGSAVPLGDEDNLLETPRTDPRLSYPGRLVESQIPRCPDDYRPQFPFPDPQSHIRLLPGRVSHKEAVVPVKHCIVAEINSSDSGQPVALREGLHSSMSSVLSACAKALNWRDRRVLRLFQTDGTEIMWVDAIRDGMRLIATKGETFIPEPNPVDKEQTTQRRETEMKQRGGLKVPLSAPAAPSKAAPLMKPFTLRVFVNGEYGDVHTEPTPYRVVTIRPAHKTLTSVMTTIGRELEWNTRGRKVELLFAPNGWEIRSLDSIRDGACVVASAGDRFIIPRANSVLNAMVQEELRGSSSIPVR